MENTTDSSSTAAPQEPREATPPLTLRASWRPVALLALLLAAFLVFRLTALTADPPDQLPNGANSYELFAEPPAKAHEARSRALFGAWHTNPEDNYQFWRVQSPAWVYPLWIWFEAFGVSYAALRTFSICVSAAGFLLAMAFALRRDSGLVTAGVAGVLVAVSFYDVLYQRSGLIEVAVGAWLAVLAYSLHRARTDATWIALSALALAAGFLSKQTMVVAIPMFLVCGLRAYLPWARDPARSRWRRALPVLFGFFLVALLAYYCTRDDYMRTVTRNFDHVIHGDTTPSEDDVVSAGSLSERLLDVEQWDHGFYSLMPVTAVLSLVQLGRWAATCGWRVVAAVLRRRGPADDRGWSTISALWLLTSLASFLTAQSELRFRMLAIAPASIMAAALVADVAAAVARPLARRGLRWARVPEAAIVLAVLVGALLPDVEAHRTWESGRTYVVQEINQKFGESLTHDDVIIGSWAPSLAFETAAQFYYVRAEFNSKRSRLRALAITHVLTMSRRDFSGAILKRVWPSAMKSLKKVSSARYRNRKITLHAVKKPPLR